MRKRYRNNPRACGVCKPSKYGWTPRWDDRELIRLRDWEREREAYLGRRRTRRDT